MTDYSPVPALFGGLLIGASASLLVLLLGRVAGISGIVAALFSARGKEIAWRAAFVLGLIAGPFAVAAASGAMVAPRIPASLPGLVLAGLLVGFGARLGGGCTSGHGVCGVSRLSPRSLLATVLFIGAGMAVVYVVRHVMGLPTWP